MFSCRHQLQASEQAMLPENPLEIPEVAGLVASNLEGKDLASCARVSKGWRDLFLPHRWRVTHVGSQLVNPWSEPPDTTSYRVGPFPDDMYFHRHLIRDLTFHRELAGLDKYHYPSLRKLTIDFTHGAVYPGQISMEFTTMFPSLVDLVLECVKVAPASWETLSAHPHIRNLKLLQVHIKAEDAPGFWKACKRLESLELHEVSIYGEGLLTNVVFERMRRVDIPYTTGLDGTALLDLMLRCPRLEDMNWCYFSDNVRPVLTHHPIRDGRWPHLNKVHINCYLQDTDVAFILERIGSGSGNMANLCLVRCELRTEASRALGLHFSTLVVLDLIRCRSVPSTTIRDVLCCCPRLEELSAGSVFAQDIVKGGPWVCQQLRELKTCFRVRKSEQHLQPLIFERLSTLTRLERLVMDSPWPDDGRSSVLEFRLDRGLGQLASLEHLTYLNFVTSSHDRRWIPQLGMEEVSWIKLHWKRLKYITGNFDMDEQVDANLKSAMKLLGIKVF